jgi:hypothetical protein
VQSFSLTAKVSRLGFVGAFKKDLDNIDYKKYNTGYFDFKEHEDEIIKKIKIFMVKVTYN